MSWEKGNLRGKEKETLFSFQNFYKNPLLSCMMDFVNHLHGLNIMTRCENMYEFTLKIIHTSLVTLYLARLFYFRKRITDFSFLTFRIQEVSNKQAMKHKIRLLFISLGFKLYRIHVGVLKLACVTLFWGKCIMQYVIITLARMFSLSGKFHWINTLD